MIDRLVNYLKVIMKKTRKNGETTRERILNAARVAFLQSGYSGTAIDDIAKMAEINRSLIFHHYENKQELWKKVKESIAQEVQETPPDFNAIHELRSFVEQLINFRFRVYDAHPELARLIAWQSLEESSEKLQGTKGLPSYEFFMQKIKDLQENNQIRKDLEPKLIITFMFSALLGVYSDEAPWFQEKPKRTQQYLDLVIDAICAGLAPRES